MLARHAGLRELKRSEGALNLLYLRGCNSITWAHRKFQSRKYNSTAQQVLDVALYLPHELLQTVHSIGFSWAAALPISALLVRACIYFPLFGLPAHRLNQRRIEALPLKQGWSHAAQISIKKDVLLKKSKNTKDLRRLANRSAKIRHLVVDRDFNIGLLAGLRPMLQFPIFYTFAEIIRRMAGAPSSLLGLIFQHMPDSTEGLDGSESMFGSVTTHNAYLEPTMASEGILWFKNLAVADPTHNLSFIVSATTFGYVWWSTHDSRSPRLNVLRVILLSGAVLIAPLTLNLPSAVLLFWLSSTTGAILQTILLNQLYPLPNAITKCLRLSNLNQSNK